ncbi:MAG: thioredoxin [Clostridia bacterium]|nr:thioredoxin [Clostridia bacterium]
MSQEVKITKQNFESIVTTSEKPVLLDFWATWCGPCMMISPIIKEIAEENPQYLIGKINVDEEPELAVSFGIESIPTLIVIKNGAITRRVSGARPKAAILSLLSE